MRDIWFVPTIPVYRTVVGISRPSLQEYGTFLFFKQSARKRHRQAEYAACLPPPYSCGPSCWTGTVCKSPVGFYRTNAGDGVLIHFETFYFPSHLTEKVNRFSLPSDETYGYIFGTYPMKPLI